MKLLALNTPAKRQQALLTSFDLLRNILFLLFVTRYFRLTLLYLRGYGPLTTLTILYKSLRARLYRIFINLPGIRTRVDAQIRSAIYGLEQKLLPNEPGTAHYTALPAEGWSAEQVKAELQKLGEMKHTRWEDGRVSGAVYHGGKELCELQTDAFNRFGVANPIHPDVFPAVRKMEAEVVAMVLGIFNAPEGSAGVTTSGGSESIIMAVLSAREKAKKERGVSRPEIILPETAHTAFRKAAEYFGITIRMVPCPAPGYRASLPHVASLINGNTVLLVGSAPNFPHGIIDDISGLSKLAIKHKLPLHVDCCLGSFLVPYLEKAGYETEMFDFRLPGVTSISVDTHKYGFAPKGNSVVLYRTTQLRKYQYFISPDWSGGVYASPNMAGSRPGALIAGCWASLMNTGESGYVDACHKIVGAAKNIANAIKERDSLKDLKVMGKPLVSVVAFKSDTLDIYDIADALSAKGWHLNALQDPPAIHVAVTLPIVAAQDDLIRDLEAVVADEKEKERRRILEGKGAKGAKKGDAAALYGVAGSLPDKTIVRELAAGFLDCLYKT
ncbi:sphingosine-1-phosphate lyase [Elsinoe australis]|uniref:sphinganine-1-phosphate aldolase n=1 Tax=Elsinoe australis TaxID=40998 RepID=A0A4U7AVP2_9PEZI|nr:sphingosine-1-phosphate lyase [Elsinoe australis]